MLRGFRMLACWVLCVGSLVDAMYNKRALADLSHIEPDKRCRAEIEDLYMSSAISGARAARMFSSAQSSGTANVADVAGISQGKNADRDVMRKMKKGGRWPPYYYIIIRGKNFRTKLPQEFKLPLMLPHEVLFQMMTINHEEDLLRAQNEKGAPDVLRHLNSTAARYRIPAGELLGLGLWLDGVPFNRPRNKSLEVLAWNIVGQGNMRIPVTCLPKDFVMKHDTFDDILQVAAWSMRCLIFGIMPSVRHDGKPWLAGDAWRQKRQEKAIGIKAALAEVRGDWAMYKEVFRFPGWRAKPSKFICWNCPCLMRNLREVRSDASWRYRSAKSKRPRKPFGLHLGGPGILYVRCF